MAVRVEFYSSLRAAAGRDAVELEAGTVADAVRQLEGDFRENADFLKLLAVSNAILNGENVTFLSGPRTKLRNGDKLVFFPPLGGG